MGWKALAWLPNAFTFQEFERTPHYSQPNPKPCCEKPLLWPSVQKSAVQASLFCFFILHFMRKLGGGGWGSTRLEKPCLGVSYGGCFIPRLTHFSGSSAPFPLLCLSSGKRNTAGCCWSRDNPTGGGATAPGREKRWWWVLFVWSWVYPALAQPSRNVTGLSLSPLESLFEMFWMYLKMLTSETHCIYSHGLWNLKATAHYHLWRQNQPRICFLDFERLQRWRPVPGSPVKLTQLPSPCVYIKDFYSFIRYHWRSFSRPPTESLRFPFPRECPGAPLCGAELAEAPVPRSEPRRPRVALPRQAAPSAVTRPGPEPPQRGQGWPAPPPAGCRWVTVVILL